MRHAGAPENRAIIRFGDLTLDLAAMQLARGGRKVELEPRVFDLLCLLVEEHGRVVSKDELLTQVWKGAHVVESSLTRCVTLARRAIGDDARNPTMIRTVHGRGYQFVASVTTGRLLAEPARDRRRSSSTSLVGRTRELGALRHALSEICGGRGQLAFVLGEAGIGKSRFLEEFRSVALRLGASVRLGRCHEADGAPAFWPWTQVLRAELKDCAAADMATILGGDAAELSRLLPELREGTSLVGSGSADESPAVRFRLFEGIVHVLRRIAARHPLVVLLDDLHRADEPSLRLLQFLAAELGELSILVVGAYRPSEGASGGLLTELVGRAGAHVLELDGLLPAEVARFVGGSTGRRISQAMAERLHEHTGGNPFFLTQVVRFMVSRGGPRPAPGFVPPLPESVRAAVARQLSALPAPTKHLLGVAAVIGREFTRDLVAAVSGDQPDLVTAAVEPALRRRLVIEIEGDSGRYRFVHVLVRDVLYEGLSSHDRARWHGRVVEALQDHGAEEPDAQLAGLAAHAYHAVPADGGGRAIEFSVVAGNRAAEQLAYEEAARHYARAVEVLERTTPQDETRRCDLLLTLGGAQMRAGSRAEAATTFQRAADLARTLGAPEKLARAALGLAPGFLVIEAGVHDEALVRLLEEAAEGLGPDHQALRAQVLGRLAIALHWAPDSADVRERLSGEAVEIAGRTSDAATMAWASVARAVALWGPDNFEHRLVMLPDVLAAAEATGDLENAVVYRLFWIATLLELGEVSNLELEIARYAQAAERIGQPHALFNVALLNTMQALRVGRLDDAERLAQDFLEMGTRVGDRNAGQSFGAVMFILASQRGQLGRLVEPVRDFASRHPNMPAWRCGLALALSLAGLRSEAAEEMRVLGRHGFADLPRHAHWALCMVGLADACATLGDRQHAAAIYDLLLPYADRHVVCGFGTATMGSAAYYLGRLARTVGRTAEAKAHLCEAIQRNRRSGCVTMAILAQAQYAAALAESGTPAERALAGTLGDEAAARARAIGLVLPNP